MWQKRPLHSWWLGRKDTGKKGLMSQHPLQEHTPDDQTSFQKVSPPLIGAQTCDKGFATWTFSTFKVQILAEL
jgi:hypothetical protein